ncbi:ABC transporter ATP-binding protein [Salicibibacter cibi]|uniref:ABC transporter ATP-binding protein n=1 Tax=Salicibibacter cibi TaxID=2743001 RepID=A0A7T6ZCI7_9BACI|nr:ABC transporter ATP-binding protein [Salicibibacter cibi]QQK80817.1 ABC transporter ATP-binding protein [Salicibibacter cibi]
MIKAKELSLKYGEHSVLKDISFELEGEKIYGLLGRNGAGKTSLLSLLAAFNQPSSGNITVDGEAPFENARVMESIMFIRDVKLEEETETVEKWIEYIAEFRPLFDHSYAAQLVRRFKLPLHEAVNKLSTGMQSALGVTVGLASRAPITIFDEAYLGMDAPARKIFYEEVLKDYMEHPRTIILSTHLISEMDGLFEEVLVIKEGSLLLHEDTETLLDRGTTVIGEKSRVDQFTAGKKVLNEQSLGGTKSVMIYDGFSDDERKEGKSLGLEFSPIALQELFIHLTEEEKHEQ